MKKLIFLALPLLLFACNSNDDNKTSAPASENDVDAARNFIRAALDGRWNEARRLIVQDSTNNQFIDLYEENYQTKMKQEDKRGYREADIHFYDKQAFGDSLVVLSYSNTYKNEKVPLKLVNNKGTWLVDFKYSFLAGKDSLNIQQEMQKAGSQKQSSDTSK